MTTAAAPPAKPRVLELNQLNIPPELCKIDAWVGWKYILREGRWNKTPIDLKTGASAKSDDPATWTSFKYAIANYRRLGCDGIGLCRTEDLFSSIWTAYSTRPAIYANSLGRSRFWKR